MTVECLVTLGNVFCPLPLNIWFDYQQNSKIPIRLWKSIGGDNPNIYIDIYIRDGTRSRDLVRSNLSRENVTRSSQNILQCLHQSCTINHYKIAILIQTPAWSFSWMTTIQLCLLRLFHMASVSGTWKAHFVAAHVWTLSFTDMSGDKTRAVQAPLTLMMWNRC